MGDEMTGVRGMTEIRGGGSKKRIGLWSLRPVTLGRQTRVSTETEREGWRGPGPKTEEDSVPENRWR